MNTTIKRTDTAWLSENETQPVKLLRRIGSTTYTVTVHHSNTSRETIADIVSRIIEREASTNAI